MIEAQVTSYFHKESPYPSGFVHNPKEKLRTPAPSLELKPDKVLPEEYWCCPKTGFNVRAQRNKLTSDLIKALKTGIDSREVFTDFITYTAEDIRHWAIEYPLNRLVFPIFLNTQDVNGQERIVAPRYNNQLYTELNDKKERQGVVFNRIEKVEESILADRKVGRQRLMVMVSGPGRTNLDYGQGEIIYKDTQIYVWEGLTARTLRFDTTLPECRAVLKELQKMGSHDLVRRSFVERIDSLIKPKNEYQRAVEVVSRVQVAKGSSRLKTAEDIVAVVERVRRRKGIKTAYKERGFNELRSDLSLGDKLLDLNENVQKCAEPHITAFTDWLNHNLNLSQDDDGLAGFLDEVEKKLGETILTIHRDLTGKEYSEDPMTELQFQEELSEMQKEDGCNGGGGEETIEVFVMTPNGPQKRRIAKYFNCPIDRGGCGMQIEAGKGISRCPNPKCRLTADQAGSSCN